MLVLSRKVSEQILVPESGLSFTILEIRGDRVRIGITAPDNVAVYRREVWARIQAEAAPQPGGPQRAVGQTA
jgi:carbon storage regulator